MSPDLEIREVPTGEMASILGLVGRQNPALTHDQLAERLTLMLAHGYRCVGAYLDNALVGVAGFWTGCRFYCGPYIDADNVVVDPDLRNRGIGNKLMEWIHDEGRRLGCRVAVLDSYVSFTDAHRFYERMGYEKLGYHFSMKLDDDKRGD